MVIVGNVESLPLCVYINELRDSSCAAAVDSFNIFYSPFPQVTFKKAAVWEWNLSSVVIKKNRDTSKDVKNIC